MNRYDLQKFLEEVKDLDYLKMIEASNIKCINLEKASYGVKGALERGQAGSSELAEKIKGFLFWLQTGQKPFGLDNSEFISFKPICIKLIEKKQLKPGALDIFLG